MKKAFFLAALSAVLSQGLFAQCAACYPSYQPSAMNQGYYYDTNSYPQQPSYYQGQTYSQGQTYYQTPAQQQGFYATEQYTTEPYRQDQSYYYYRNDQRPNFQQQQAYPAPTERLSSWRQRQNADQQMQVNPQQGYYANDQYKTDTTNQNFRAGQSYNTTTPNTTQMGTQQDISR